MRVRRRYGSAIMTGSGDTAALMPEGKAGGWLWSPRHVSHQVSRFTLHVPRAFCFSAKLKCRSLPRSSPQGEPGGFLATVNAPLDVRALAEHVGLHERADVQADTVIQVRVRSDGLLLLRLPADEDAVRRFVFQYQLEPVLELAGLVQAVVTPLARLRAVTRPSATRSTGPPPAPSRGSE